jgi:hypothetical protein
MDDLTEAKIGWKMDDDDRKRVAHGVAFEEAVFKAHDNGDRRVKLDVGVAYCVANEVKRLRGEAERREYYQGIVYEVCAILDACADVGGTLRVEGSRVSRITCGTEESPSTGVQDALRDLIEQRRGSRASAQDAVWLAMHQAVGAYGGEADGVFNAAGFSSCLMRIAGLKGVIDGILVSAILAGRTDVEALDSGGSHYRLLGER